MRKNTIIKLFTIITILICFVLLPTFKNYFEFKMLYQLPMTGTGVFIQLTDKGELTLTGGGFFDFLKNNHIFLNKERATRTVKIKLSRAEVKSMKSLIKKVKKSNAVKDCYPDLSVSDGYFICAFISGKRYKSESVSINKSLEDLFIKIVDVFGDHGYPDKDFHKGQYWDGRI